MSLTRQAALLLVGALWLAILGSLGVHALGMQRTLQVQLDVRNRDSASLMALALSQQGADETLMQTVAAATFDLGHYRRLTLRGADGRVWFDLRSQDRLAQAPQWLVDAMPIDAPAGMAQVTDGWRPIGQLEVSAHSAWAHESLWSALQHTAALLAVMGALAGLAAMLALRAWQRPLDVTVAQAQALEDGRFVIADEPRAPELQRLTRSMNSMVRRLQQWFDSQAAQVDALQRLTQTDPVTALPNRRRFMALLETSRQGSPGHVGALLLVRLQDLQGLNERLGHQAADEVLRSIADVLQNYPNQVHGAFAGRLNGSDFALALPVAGIAGETASSLMQALRSGPAGRVADVQLVIGGVDGADALPLAALLASADGALAQAEATGPFAVEVRQGAADSAVQAGAHAWRVGIEQSLAAGHARLDAQAVRDRAGALLYLSCPLQLRLEPGTEYVPARHWLPLAARSRLLPRVDLTSIELALQAIDRDSLARSVSVSAASLAEPGFIDQVKDLLVRHIPQCRLLLLEVTEPTTEPLVRELRDAVAVWRATGVRVGIEDAGGTLQGRAWLQSVSLQQVRIGGRTIAGVAGDPAVQQYARSLAALVHGLGWHVVAADIDDPADLAAIWHLGFDGAAGGAVAAAG